MRTPYEITARLTGSDKVEVIARFVSFYEAARYALWISKQCRAEIDILDQNRKSRGVYLNGKEFVRNGAARSSV
jgi:hypothetical protein